MSSSALTSRRFDKSAATAERRSRYARRVSRDSRSTLVPAVWLRVVVCCVILRAIINAGGWDVVPYGGNRSTSHLFLLRRRGGVARHTLAFIVGTIVSLALFGVWIAIQLSGGPIGNYRTDVMAGIWAVAIGVTVLLQVLAMVIAMLLRK